jgi:hypothetical protein
MEPIPDGTRAHMTRVGGVVLIAGGVLGTIVALIAQEERFQVRSRSASRASRSSSPSPI